VLRFNDQLLPGGDFRCTDGGVFQTFGNTDLRHAYSQAAAQFGRPDVLLVVSDGDYDKPIDAMAGIKHRRRVRPEHLAASLTWLRQPALPPPPGDDPAG